MIAIQFYIDEDVFLASASELRRRGIDAISTQEAGRRSCDDESQLRWASENRRTIVTFNVGDYLALHATWLRSGRSHFGIIASSQRPIGDLIRRLGNLHATLSAEEIQDRIEFLSAW
ncbi:MAG: DUF5615 family PIN-like protein [Planctomycetia bacterium]|nr:DUF5615 family PIN-like protein [Planctomycetia bacterium]